MTAARDSGQDTHVGSTDVDIVIDAGEGAITVTLDRTHTMLAAVRDAHRTVPPPPKDDDPRHELFERELHMLLRMARQDSRHSEDELLARRDALLDRIGTVDDLEPLFDEMIDEVLTAGTVEACVDTRFEIRLLAAVLSIYRPDLYTSGALEIGQHFYGRAERKLVMDGKITDHALQRAL